MSDYSFTHEFPHQRIGGEGATIFNPERKSK